MKNLIYYMMGIVCLMALPSKAEARLGEALEELNKRFGKPIEEKIVSELNLKQISYKNHDLLIGVTLIDGKSASEQYMRSSFKRDENGKLILLPLSKDLVDAIMGANASGLDWNLVSKEESADSKKYVRADMGALAMVAYTHGNISEVRLSTSAFNRHMTSIKK